MNERPKKKANDHRRSRLQTEDEVKAFLGMHIAEIVHNLNGPLTVLRASIESLRRDLGDDTRIQYSSRALDRMQDIIRLILKSSRRNAQTGIEDIQINEVIRDELALLEGNAFFREHVRLTEDLGELPAVRGQYTHFSQSLGNLLKNAVDAMYSTPKKDLLITSRHKGGHIIVRIEDSGCGIDPAHMEKLFDPFFTTKPLVTKHGEPTGTGLGLASAKRMLESYGAEILIESNPSQGTTVSVLIPLEQPELPHQG